MIITIICIYWEHGSPLTNTVSGLGLPEGRTLAEAVWAGGGISGRRNSTWEDTIKARGGWWALSVMCHKCGADFPIYVREYTHILLFFPVSSVCWAHREVSEDMLSHWWIDWLGSVSTGRNHPLRRMKVNFLGLRRAKLNLPCTRGRTLLSSIRTTTRAYKEPEMVEHRYPPPSASGGALPRYLPCPSLQASSPLSLVRGTVPLRLEGSFLV